jgi:hypothetical protein
VIDQIAIFLEENSLAVFLLLIVELGALTFAVAIFIKLQ